jgi:hypothetical protein
MQNLVFFVFDLYPTLEKPRLGKHFVDTNAEKNSKKRIFAKLARQRKQYGDVWKIRRWWGDTSCY